MRKWMKSSEKHFLVKKQVKVPLTVYSMLSSPLFSFSGAMSVIAYRTRSWSKEAENKVEKWKNVNAALRERSVETEGAGSSGEAVGEGSALQSLGHETSTLTNWNESHQKFMWTRLAQKGQLTKQHLSGRTRTFRHAFTPTLKWFDSCLHFTLFWHHFAPLLFLLL